MSQAWTDTIEKYREFVAAHSRGLADPDKDGLEGLEAERRDTIKNRWLIEQIGLIVSMEKDYMSSPKLGPLASKVWSRIEHVRAEMQQIGRRERDIKVEIENERDGYSYAKGAAKRKHTAAIKVLQAEQPSLGKRYDELRAYLKILVDWDLGLAVAKDAGIQAFDKKWSRHEEHDVYLTPRAVGWAPSGYEVRDENNRVVARSRSKVAAHRASRRAAFVGTHVNRANAVPPERHESQRARHKKWTAYILENGYRDEGAFEHRPGEITKKEAESQAWRTMADEDAYYAQRPRAYEGFDEDTPSDVQGRL